MISIPSRKPSAGMRPVSAGYFAKIAKMSKDALLATVTGGNIEPLQKSQRNRDHAGCC